MGRPCDRPAQRLAGSQSITDRRNDGTIVEYTRLREQGDLRVCVERAEGADIALLGEMTHGTADFYDVRAELTMSLVAAGFRVVALEADWPDGAAIDAYVRGRSDDLDPWLRCDRWPTWMWRNRPFLSFIERLRLWNRGRPEDEQVRVVGLDVYSMPESIGAVLDYLRRHDPDAERAARERYDCLATWREEPAEYGAAVRQGLADCKEDVLAVLEQLLENRLDGIDLFDAQQNARVVAGAEAYYRGLYEARTSTWDLRDTHMADTLDVVREATSDARVAVWAHNSHVGDARATSGMHETTLGTLCRQRHASWSLGAFTDHGTVTAGDHWGAPARRFQVRPSRPDSHGHWLAGTGSDRMILRVDDLDLPERLERAIGVVYRPSTEGQSHHFPSRLQDRYDDVLWLQQTRATEPLPTHVAPGTPDTWPSAF